MGFNLDAFYLLNFLQKDLLKTEPNLNDTHHRPNAVKFNKTNLVPAHYMTNLLINTQTEHVIYQSNLVNFRPTAW